MANFKPKRQLFTIQKKDKKSWNKIICLQTHFREITLSAIHHQLSVLIFQHSSATLMHQYQQGENGQPNKIQELRIFLQIQKNIVRSIYTDKMHFWLLAKNLPDASQHFFIEFRTNILQTDLQPYPFILGPFCENVDCNLRVRDLKSRGPWFGDHQMHCVVLVSLTRYFCLVLAQSWLALRL